MTSHRSFADIYLAWLLPVDCLYMTHQKRWPTAARANSFSIHRGQHKRIAMLAVVQVDRNGIINDYWPGGNDLWSRKTPIPQTAANIGQVTWSVSSLLSMSSLTRVASSQSFRMPCKSSSSSFLEVCSSSYLHSTNIFTYHVCSLLSGHDRTFPSTWRHRWEHFPNAFPKMISH